MFKEIVPKRVLFFVFAWIIFFMSLSCKTKVAPSSGELTSSRSDSPPTVIENEIARVEIDGKNFRGILKDSDYAGDIFENMRADPPNNVVLLEHTSRDTVEKEYMVDAGIYLICQKDTAYRCELRVNKEGLEGFYNVTDNANYLSIRSQYLSIPGYQEDLQHFYGLFPDVQTRGGNGKTKTLPTIEGRSESPLKIEINPGSFKITFVKPSRIVPVAKSSDSLIQVKESDRDFEIILDGNKGPLASDTAKIFYENMNIEENQTETGMEKVFSTNQNPGLQTLSLSCSMTSGQESEDPVPMFSCRLNLSKPQGNSAAYKAHLAKNNKSIFIVRNDTDFPVAAAAIENVFSGILQWKNLGNGKVYDKELGFSIIKGQEISVPVSDQAPMNLFCRTYKQAKFCKFHFVLN